MQTKNQSKYTHKASEVKSTGVYLNTRVVMLLNNRHVFSQQANVHPVPEKNHLSQTSLLISQPLPFPACNLLDSVKANTKMRAKGSRAENSREI